MAKFRLNIILFFLCIVFVLGSFYIRSNPPTQTKQKIIFLEKNQKNRQSIKNIESLFDGPTYSESFKIDENIAEIKKELTRLNEDLFNLKKEIIALKQTLSRKVSETDQNLASKNLDYSEIPSEVINMESIDQIELRTKQMHSYFESENVDFDWSKIAEQKLRNHIENEYLQDGILLDIKCRSTMCRTIVEFPDLQSLDEIYPLLPPLSPWDGAGLVHVEESESGTTLIVYTGKEGENLPIFD